MLRLGRLGGLLKKAGTPSAKVDTSHLSAQQLEEIRDAVNRDDGEGANADAKVSYKSAGWRKFGVSNRSGEIAHRSKQFIRAGYHIRDGSTALQKTKNPMIDFKKKGYPNYPGDPLPTKQLGQRKEFQKPKMHNQFFKQEVAIQFAPFRRTLINIAHNSQGILPKQLIEGAKSEFVGINRGSGKREGEPNYVNRFSSFKYTNPRSSKRDMCVIAGQPLGNVQRFRMHRMFFRTFADHNKISGVTTMKFGPMTPLHNPFCPKESKKYGYRNHQWHDDLPIYR